MAEFQLKHPNEGRPFLGSGESKSFGNPQSDKPTYPHVDKSRTTYPPKSSNVSSPENGPVLIKTEGCVHCRVRNGKNDARKDYVLDVGYNTVQLTSVPKGNFVFYFWGMTTGTCLAMELAGVVTDLGGAKTLGFKGKLMDLPISSLDLILGMEWLESLGEITHDWHKAWMRFIYQGTDVQLQGLSSNYSGSAALHQWLSFDEPSFDSNSPFITVSSALANVQHPAFTSLLSNFSHLFCAPLGLPPPRSHDHTILLNSTQPICVCPYRYPHLHKTENERQVQELLALGMIQASTSAYSSPVILVRKKDKSWRMCVDYRALYKVTIPNKYPIPVVEELLDELHGNA
ncbi:hypothetical protein E3N88_00984 [Mikania micrantha]|uniref:Reverse transcriptase domain-containing protein n=1 Tax=Mikania micrantha TaxID=192012 RepID=A0A5N6Q203_9ASTR|nr:hypothetical protein E3N88_00984 [Mikania micrantha]